MTPAPITLLDAAPGDGPVTVFYPSADAARPTQRARFTLDLAVQGAPVPGNGRLVICLLYTSPSPRDS